MTEVDNLKLSVVNNSSPIHVYTSTNMNTVIDITGICSLEKQLQFVVTHSPSVQTRSTSHVDNYSNLNRTVGTDGRMSYINASKYINNNKDHKLLKRKL